MTKSTKKRTTVRRRTPQGPKRTAAAGNRTRRPGGSRAIASLLEEMQAASGEPRPEGRGAGAALAAAEPPVGALAAAPAQKAVTFTCSNAQCLVGITVGSVNVVFTGSGGSLFPVGSGVAHWRVKGAGKFSITASGATLSAISSTAPDAGLASFVVTP